jgi:hypothetical protein
MDWLTDPTPQHTICAIPASAYRSTRLYTAILILFIYTHFTFAQEAIVHPQDWAYRLSNASTGFKRSAAHEQDPNDELYIAPLHVDTGRKTDAFVDDGNSARTYEVPQRKPLCPLSLTKKFANPS